MVAPKNFKRISVKQCIIEYRGSLKIARATGSLSENTVASYERDLKEFEAIVGSDTILDDISSDDLDRVMVTYQNTPDKRYNSTKASTRGLGATKRFKQSVSRLFSFGVRKGWVQLNPVPDMIVTLKGQQRPKEARTALPRTSAESLLHTTIQNGKDAEGKTRKDQQSHVRDEFILRVLMEVGPRVSELVKADQADIYVERVRGGDPVYWFNIRFAKGGKHRRVPLSKRTYDSFLEYQKVRPEVAMDAHEDAERALLLTWRGRRMSARDVQNRIHTLTSHVPAELRREVTPHGLRHTAASILLSEGLADVATVRDMLGHASIATTSLYLDTQEENLVKAVTSHPVTG